MIDDICNGFGFYTWSRILDGLFFIFYFCFIILVFTMSVDFNLKSIGLAFVIL